VDGEFTQPEIESEQIKVLKSDERPFDYTPVSIADLPQTPTRDRNIAASAWDQAPQVLKKLGEDLAGKPEAASKDESTVGFCGEQAPLLDLVGI